MKKQIMLSIVLCMGLLINTSCKKNYQCSCTSVYSGGSYNFYAGAKSTKKDAKAWCYAFEKSNTQTGITTTCTLD